MRPDLEIEKSDSGKNKTHPLTFDNFGNVRMKLLKIGLKIGQIFPIKCFLTGLAFAANDFLVFLGVEDLHLVKLILHI